MPTKVRNEYGERTSLFRNPFLNPSQLSFTRHERINWNPRMDASVTRLELRNPFYSIYQIHPIRRTTIKDHRSWPTTINTSYDFNENITLFALSALARQDSGSVTRQGLEFCGGDRRGSRHRHRRRHHYSDIVAAGP